MYKRKVYDTIPSTSSTWISECWANARLQMRAQGQEEMILVIDEIQKLKNWSEYVKKEWDTDSLNRINLKVALLSPSRVLLEKGLAESLMGRYEERWRNYVSGAIVDAPSTRTSSWIHPSASLHS